MAKPSKEPLAPGTAIPVRTLPPIDQAHLLAYAEASGDHNRIHLDDTVARAMGLPGVIAHGMLSAAFLAERANRYIFDELEVSGGRLAHFSARFKSMTQLGDVIEISGQIKDHSETEVTLELSARNQRGETTTTALARFVIA